MRRIDKVIRQAHLDAAAIERKFQINMVYAQAMRLIELQRLLIACYRFNAKADTKHKKD